MPPIVASFLTFGFIFYLFRLEARQSEGVTRAVWLPVIWFVLNSSRYLSEWFALFGFSLGAVSLEEGSPFDAFFYCILLASGVRVLIRRQVRLEEVIRANWGIALFLGYCFLAITWSDFAFVALKRWIKILGHPLMALILFTEPNPEKALTVFMKGAAFILLPISMLFIKYYPEWGRQFSFWTGAAMNTGITTNKNILGCDCMIVGLFFACYVFRVRKTLKGKAKRNELLICGLILYWVWWLLSMAQSSTALAALILGIVVYLVLSIPGVSYRWLGVYAVVAILGFVLLELGFEISSSLIDALGRDSTLTGRTELWDDALRVPINPLLGAGFESFWLGPRREALWERHPWRPNQAHNGYLETYLNLGVLGVVVLIVMILASMNNARKDIGVNPHRGKLRLACLVAIVAYNWTEATFKALHPVWFLFYLVAFELRRTTVSVSAAVPERAEKMPQLDVACPQPNLSGPSLTFAN